MLKTVAHAPKKYTPEKDKESSRDRCLFVPTRANQKACTETPTTRWGFCSKHSRTVQSKEAKKRFEDSIKEEQEQKLKALDDELAQELADLVDSSDEEEKMVISPNYWGRFEERDSGIVFDPDTKNAYGIQAEDGLIEPLDEEAIKTCIENGWRYTVSTPTKKTGKIPKEKPKEATKGRQPVLECKTPVECDEEAEYCPVESEEEKEDVDEQESEED